MSKPKLSEEVLDILHPLLLQYLTAQLRCGDECGCYLVEQRGHTDRPAWL